MSEKEPSSESAAKMPLPGGDFRLLVSKLSIQGMLSLGILENPISKKAEVNLTMAKALIDDLAMLREKTKGNLDPDEQSHLEKILSDLQWQFVQRSGTGNPS